MRPADLIRRLRRLATARGLEIEIAEGARHTKVRLNGRPTTVPRHRDELKPGTLSAILKQRGLTRSDLEV